MWQKNMLRPYLKIWEWELIFGCALKAISSLGVCRPWHEPINWPKLTLFQSSFNSLLSTGCSLSDKINTLSIKPKYYNIIIVPWKEASMKNENSRLTSIKLADYIHFRICHWVWGSWVWIPLKSTNCKGFLEHFFLFCWSWHLVLQ